VHHLVADGESAGILAADLWRHYAAGHPATGGPGDDAPPGQPGTDPARRAAEAVASAVASAVARRHEGRDEQGLRDYWLGVLTDGEPVELPDDGAPDDPSPGTGSVPIELAAGPIGDFARRNRLSVFAVLLAGYQRTVTRYARCRRALVAVPVSTRDDPSLDGVVGCFVNRVGVRWPGDDRLPSVEYGRGVPPVAARGIDHAALPYPRIAELAGDPLAAMTCTFTFQSWQGAGSGEWCVPGLRVRHLDCVHQQVVGDLTLELFATGRSVRGRLRYAERRLAPQTAAAFAAQLVATVEAMVTGRDTPVALLPDVPVRVDRTDIDFDRDADVDQLLRVAAHRHADRVAVQDGAAGLTYLELDARVERAATGLRRRGVTPGDRVGIWLPRCVDQVVAVLATLRAGAVFVAMEPEHPEARLASIADRVGLALVVRERSAAPTPGGGHSASVADLTGPDPDPRPDPAVVPGPQSRAGEPAYVLFTSGSTGVPKGVVVGHRALVNQLRWGHRHFALGPDDVMAYSGTLSFDVTVHQLLAPLTRGARLAVLPQGQQRDPEAMARTMLRQRVSVLHIVPALLRLLVDETAFAENLALRAVISVGEPLTNQLREAFQRVQAATLYNGYGPTEATIYATVFDTSAAARQRWTRQVDVPIGHPMDNVRCHLLDEHLRPVPPGAPGELCLAGVALADGYHGDPQQTAARFPTVRLGDAPERVYRTGDLARSLPTGDLSFLGRLDHQVKVNGFRIELGEVEAALLAIPGVRQAVAVVHRHAAGHGQLIGYVTPGPVDEADALAALSACLPGYMVPARLVTLDSLPRLANGKLDRSSLAALPAGAGPATPPVAGPGAGAAAAGVPPRRQGETVALLRRAWAEVIGTPPSDDRAHFFTGGGDSILAMRLVSALRRAGVRVDLRQLHDTPVLADLAAHLDGAARHRQSHPEPDAPQPRPPVGPDPEGTRLAPIQHWFLDTVRTDRHHWNQSVLLDVYHPVDRRILALAVQAVLLAHPTLSTRLVDDRVEPVPPFTAVAARRLMDTATVDTPQALDGAVAALHRDLDPRRGDVPGQVPARRGGPDRPAAARRPSPGRRRRLLADPARRPRRRRRGAAGRRAAPAARRGPATPPVGIRPRRPRRGPRRRGAVAGDGASPQAGDRDPAQWNTRPRGAVAGRRVRPGPPGHGTAARSAARRRRRGRPRGTHRAGRHGRGPLEGLWAGHARRGDPRPAGRLRRRHPYRRLVHRAVPAGGRGGSDLGAPRPGAHRRPGSGQGPGRGRRIRGVPAVRGGGGPRRTRRDTTGPGRRQLPRALRP
jgi:amino acid adenylation domain-containing protein